MFSDPERRHETEITIQGLKQVFIFYSVMLFFFRTYPLGPTVKICFSIYMLFMAPALLCSVLLICIIIDSVITASTAFRKHAWYTIAVYECMDHCRTVWQVLS